MSDIVNHPDHYTSDVFECIDLTAHYSFCVGNAIKYVWRHQWKGKPLEDLRKAQWYLKTALLRGERAWPIDNATVDEMLKHKQVEGDKRFWNALSHEDILGCLTAVDNMIHDLETTEPDHGQSK